MKFAKPLLYFFAATTLIASIVTGTSESEILRESVHAASSTHKYSIKLKGKIYYVTSDQWNAHEVGESFFIVSLLITFGLIYFLRSNGESKPL
jgi:hypothetical protein